MMKIRMILENYWWNICTRNEFSPSFQNWVIYIPTGGKL